MGAQSLLSMPKKSNFYFSTKKSTPHKDAFKAILFRGLRQSAFGFLGACFMEPPLFRLEQGLIDIKSLKHARSATGQIILHLSANLLPSYHFCYWTGNILTIDKLSRDPGLKSNTSNIYSEIHNSAIKHT